MPKNCGFRLEPNFCVSSLNATLMDTVENEREAGLTKSLHSNNKYRVQTDLKGNPSQLFSLSRKANTGKVNTGLSANILQTHLAKTRHPALIPI